MSAVQTITSIAPASTSSSVMSSHQPSTSNSTSAAAHSYLLGSLQQPSTAVTPGKARKHAQAQRSHLVKLSKHLIMRLQYANFKVEHGWTKQSLSEVENLYYRQREGGPVAGRRSTSTSPNGPTAKGPVTPAAASNPTLGSRLFKDAAASKRAEVEDGDVFGGYGLATPPTSGGTVPGAQTASLAQKRGRSVSATPVSPPAAGINPAQGETGPTRRSPHSGATLRNRASTASMQTANGVTSYADFWSRVGTTGAVSPNKKRNADNFEVGDSADVDVSPEDTAPAVVSPKKRVRVDESAEHPATLSPAKAALTERGPSFASSGRK